MLEKTCERSSDSEGGYVDVLNLGNTISEAYEVGEDTWSPRKSDTRMGSINLT